MDEYLMMLIQKHLNLEDERIVAKEFRLKGKVLVGKIKLLYCLIKNNTKRYLKEELLQSIECTRNIEEIMLKVKQWKCSLQKERSDFCRFQRNVEIDQRAADVTKECIEENLKRILKVCAAEYSSKVLATNLENKIRKNFLQTEIGLIENRLKSIRKLRCLRENNLYDARFKMKKQYLDQLARYDNDIKALYTCKITLLIDKEFIEEQHIIIEEQLIEQRILYNQLKEECEAHAKEIFLAKLEYFCRTRAAKIIQRNWRFYRVRVSWRKRRGRK